MSVCTLSKERYPGRQDGGLFHERHPFWRSRRPQHSASAFRLGDRNERVIITRWNSRVGPGDEIWHLGDFARGLKVAEAILPRLNGRKHLVTGNNDEPAVCALNWSSVQAYTELLVDGVMLVLCHYPFRTWNRIDRGSINLHGHSHGRLKPLTRQFDVGVDAHDFQPISLRELLVSRRVADSRTQ